LKALPVNCRSELLQFTNGESSSNFVARDTRNVSSGLNTSKSIYISNVSYDGLCDTSELEIRESNHTALSYSDNPVPSASGCSVGT